MCTEHGLEGKLSDSVYIVKYPLSLFYTCSLFNSRALTTFRSLLQTDKISVKLGASAWVNLLTSPLAASPCLFLLHTISPQDRPQVLCYKSTTGSGDKAFFLFLENHTLTHTLARRCVPHKVKSGLCGSSQPTQPVAGWTQPVSPRPWLSLGCGPQGQCGQNYMLFIYFCQHRA